MKEDEAILAAMGKSLMRSLTSQMIADGVIDPADMSEENFRGAIRSELIAITEDEANFDFILDHQDSVLDQARAYVKVGQEDFAIMFYATWIEHWFNDMFVWKVTRMGKARADAVPIIRFNGLKEKTSRVWTETFGEGLDRGLAGGILDIAGRRNAFVHYKWQAMEEDEMADETAKKIALLATAEEVVGKLTTLKKDMVFGDAHRFMEGL